jgi:hypothetical protein
MFDALESEKAKAFLETPGDALTRLESSAVCCSVRA